MQKRNRKWTEAEDQKLLALVVSRRSNLSIGVALKRSRSAISDRLKVLRDRGANLRSDGIAESNRTRDKGALACLR